MLLWWFLAFHLQKKKSDVKLIFCFSVSSFFSVCFSGKIFFFNSFKNHQIHLVLFLFLIFTGISKLCIFRRKYFLSLLRNCVGFTSTCSFYVLGVSCGLVLFVIFSLSPGSIYWAYFPFNIFHLFQYPMSCPLSPFVVFTLLNFYSVVFIIFSLWIVLHSALLSLRWLLLHLDFESSQQLGTI